MKKVCNIITIVIFTFLIGFAALLVGPLLAGYTPYIIGGQGMGEELPNGGVAYTKVIYSSDKVEQALSPGDLMSFYLSRDRGVISTRRVHLINSEKRLIYTRGDGQRIVDNKAVAYSDVLGRVAFTVKNLGGVFEFFKSNGGIILLCFLLMVLIVSIFLPEILEPEDDIAELVSQDEMKGGLVEAKSALIQNKEL